MKKKLARETDGKRENAQPARELHRHATRAHDDLDDLRKWARDGAAILERVREWIDSVAPEEERNLEHFSREVSVAIELPHDPDERAAFIAWQERLYAETQPKIQRIEAVIANMRDPIALAELAVAIRQVSRPLVELLEVLPRASESSAVDAVDETLRREMPRDEIARQLDIDTAALDKRRSRRRRI